MHTGAVRRTAASLALLLALLPGASVAAPVAASVADPAVEATDPATIDDLRTAASWSATAARVARGWLDTSLPDRYARRTLKIAADELLQVERSIGRRGDRSAATAVVDRTAAVRRATDAVERHDAAALVPVLTELDRQSRPSPATP